MEGTDNTTSAAPAARLDAPVQMEVDGNVPIRRFAEAAANAGLMLESTTTGGLRLRVLDPAALRANC